MFNLKLNGIMSTKGYTHEQSYLRVFVVSLFFLCIFHTISLFWLKIILYMDSISINIPR